MNVRYVRQQHPHGCGIAVLAMITGLRYMDIYSTFDAAGMIEIGGIYPAEVEQFLYRQGFALRKLRGRTEPFAPLHYAQVCTSASAPSGHFVVVNEIGGVLDPHDDAIRKLTNYPHIDRLVGVYKVTT